MSKTRYTSDILKKRAKKNKGNLLSRIIRFAVKSTVFILLIVCMLIAGTYVYLRTDLPKISVLKDYRPPIITNVYSDDNRKIAEFFRERRIVVPLSMIPERLKEAFVAAEDARFYQHSGIDFLSIIRAFTKNLEAGSIVQGGSTITQQITKSFFLTPEKTYIRKIKEAILAYNLTQKFTKEEILFLYLNQIYLGHGAYGVEAAAENYFGKSVNELNLAECAMMAGLPQAPSRYSPYKNPESAKQRQIYVLNRMIAEGYITNLQATEAMNTKINIKSRRNLYIEEVPFYTEQIRQYIENTYGTDTLYTQGLKIFTCVNIDMQKAAALEIKKGLETLDKRQGYRGPLKHLSNEEIEPYSDQLAITPEFNLPEESKIVTGVVVKLNDTDNYATVRMGNSFGRIFINDMKWARRPDPEKESYEDIVKHPTGVLKIGDVILVKVKNKIENSDIWRLSLEQTPEVQSALLCIESETGYVKAIVGGQDFKKSPFNRAIQSRRQPGSAFKPIIYAAAIDKGYTPATIIFDSPIVFKDTTNDVIWKPKNYGERFDGPTLFREALSKSRNVVTIKILQDIGIDYAIDYAKKMGISSQINRDLSIALGSSGVSLLEIVTAYSVFNNMGYLVKPVFITKILDKDDNVIEETKADRKRVLEKSTAYIMTSLLEDVVQHGTGTRARVLGRPVAGKTGTTNNLYDAWFVGYTPRYTTGVWVGFDKEQSLGKGETGARAASPIWIGFMKKILEDKPIRMFPVPEGVVFSKIDAETGLLPIPESKKVIFECFKEGTAPTEYTKKPDSITDTEDFFKSVM
jgi:penicillin-binding protein 1A